MIRNNFEIRTVHVNFKVFDRPTMASSSNSLIESVISKSVKNLMNTKLASIIVFALLKDRTLFLLLSRMVLSGTFRLNCVTSATFLTSFTFLNAFSWSPVHFHSTSFPNNERIWAQIFPRSGINPFSWFAARKKHRSPFRVLGLLSLSDIPLHLLVYWRNSCTW